LTVISNFVGKVCQYVILKSGKIPWIPQIRHCPNRQPTPDWGIERVPWSIVNFQVWDRLRCPTRREI